jgi:hypothetical protein
MATYGYESAEAHTAHGLSTVIPCVKLARVSLSYEIAGHGEALLVVPASTAWAVPGACITEPYGTATLFGGT